MNERDIIVELAKYINGNISDTNGVYESFFRRNTGNAYSFFDGLVSHMKSEGAKLRREKINKTDPYKHRCYNFQEGTHYITIKSQGQTTKVLICK